MKDKLPIAGHLTDEEYMHFLQAYALHNRSMGLDERRNYTLSNITTIERDVKENCFNVYYDNGNWWHYAKDGTWYLIKDLL